MLTHPTLDLLHELGLSGMASCFKALDANPAGRNAAMLEASDDDGLAAHVRDILRRVWDPIDLGAWGPEDEYDAYVPVLVTLRRHTMCSKTRSSRIESEAMCLSLAPDKRTRAARALLGLHHPLMDGPGKIVEQWSNPDGSRCAWVFEISGGLYTYVESMLRQEDDENGLWSWWADAVRGGTGLFATGEDARREACTVICWLRDSDFAASASLAVLEDWAGGWRALDPRERAVLDHLLGSEFPGRDGLTTQLLTAQVCRIDEGSLHFPVHEAPAAVATRVPVKGGYCDNNASFGPAVNGLLHIVNGRLHELEVYKDAGSAITTGPFEVPTDQIEVWPGKN